MHERICTWIGNVWICSVWGMSAIAKKCAPCQLCDFGEVFVGRFMFWQSAVCAGYQTDRSRNAQINNSIVSKMKIVEEGPSPMASKAATIQIAHLARKRWDPKYSASIRSHTAFKRPLGFCADCEFSHIFALHWNEKSREGYETSETMHLQTQHSVGEWHAGVYQPCKQSITQQWGFENSG